MLAPKSMRTVYCTEGRMVSVDAACIHEHHAGKAHLKDRVIITTYIIPVEVRRLGLAVGGGSDGRHPAGIRARLVDEMWWIQRDRGVRV